MFRRSATTVALLVLGLLLGQAGLAVRFAHEAQAATAGSVRLRVQEQVSGAHPGTTATAITTYKWMISAERTGGAYGYVPGAVGRAGYDGTGDASDAQKASCLPGGANYANLNTACQWPSVRYTPGAVPIVAQGDQSTFANNAALAGLQPGRYLISVTADGHKIDGAHFTVAGGGTTDVTVSMFAYPLPLGTLRLRVFQDTAPVDGTYEIGTEAPLAGFTAHINDPGGEVTTDFFGNPLCTEYAHDAPDATHPLGAVSLDADGSPIVARIGTGCRSDADGDVVIPNLGPNRYTASVVPPTGQKWYQTTTLEGNHDWDMWIAEGETGYDTELTVGGEPVPPVHMGFVPHGSGSGADAAPPAFATTNAGSISGTIVEINTYVGGTGGVNVPNAGVAGANVRGPVDQPIITLSDLGANDQMVYVGRGGSDGRFTIANVPDGDYQLTVWDLNQEMILDSFNVTVNDGQAVDVGQKGIVDWFTDIHGHVFIDTNGNGRKDPGEVGVPQFPIGFKNRDNTTLDAGQNGAQTDRNGYYDLREGYPISKFLILEAFNTRYKTTGITVQADNEPAEITYLGAAVDLDVLAIIGLAGRVDWGVQPYAGTENGGIAGTVTYDSTRNELDPKDAVTEPFQPGIPGLTMHLYYPLRDPDTGDPLYNDDGSVKVLLGTDGQPLDVGGRDAGDDGTYTTETWDQPTGCTARMHDGTVLTDQKALPPPGDDSYICVEAPMSGWQAVPSDKTPGNFGSTVNGNYAFASLAYDPAALEAEATSQASGTAPADLGAPLAAEDSVPITNDDWVVKADVPKTDGAGTCTAAQLGTNDAACLYQVTKEEDINVFDGDTRLPQENFPLPADITSSVGSAPPADPTDPGEVSQSGGIVSPCVGANHTVQVTSQAFIDAGGSPFEGKARHLCDEKLITVRGGQAVAPNFNFFTPVPLPTHFWGLTINDLGLSQDKTQIGYGEAQPLPNVPMGIYDWSGRLVDTVDTDYNGMYEALEPSTTSANCPSPTGYCTGMFYFKGNDPGQPGHVNANYNPRFRTIGTNFQAWPGQYTVTDTAPTQVAAVSTAPGSTQINAVDCSVNAGVTAANQKTPEIWRIDKPYWISGDGTSRTLTGVGFGTTTPTVTAVNSTGGTTNLTVTSFSDTSVTFTAPSGSGAYTILVRNAASGRTSVNGIGFHRIGGSYVPRLIQVNPPSSAVANQSSRQGNSTSPRLNLPSTAFPAVTSGDPNTTPENVLQRAVDLAASGSGSNNTLVVVWPNAAVTNNPTGDYVENIVVHSNVKLQGVGTGGGSGAGFVVGSRINGLGFNPDNLAGAAWLATVAGLTHDGPADVPDAAVVTYLGRGNVFQTGFNGALDGFYITGGAQADFPTNVNALYGGTTTPAGAPGALITQGGGIYLHASANNVRIADNVIEGNSGSYGGGIRVGTPYTAVEGSPNSWSNPVTNTGLVVSHNRITHNGGSNLAGGVGIFDGSDNYTVADNDLCGNFSAEYGGGISHYGLSNRGAISTNRIYLNASYDEAGGVMVAGELNPNLTEPSAGATNAGTMTIDANAIQDNVANDDGGGLRFLQAGTRQINVTNNVVNDNISTHEGGGIALDDSTNVHIIGNTVMNNITTATAITSNGRPAPAGLSTATNSDQLQATLGNTASRFSNPQDFRANIIWGNLAGTWNANTGTVTGIDLASSPKVWEMGSLDAGVTLTPTNSIMANNDPQVTTSPSNKVNGAPNYPSVVAPYTVGVQIITSRLFPAFREAVIVVVPVAPNLQGDYHLNATSPALSSGGARPSQNTLPTMQHDIDLQARPANNIDIGADER